MKRSINIAVGNKFGIEAKACLVKNLDEYEVDVSKIMAVDLKDSKSIQMATGDFGIVIYNELNFGFVLSWNLFEGVQAELNIQEADYEDFLDKVCNNFSDTILGYIDEK